jgi:hypothetical protein
VRAEVPGARFAMPAYHWGFAPPGGMLVPDHVRVYPMTIQVDYSAALNDARNARLRDRLVRWNEIAQHVTVWDHVVDFGGYLQPTPNLYPIGRSIAWLATLPHVDGYFAEGDWRSRGGEFASLRVWLIARLLWTPTADARALVREYCDAYYGAAGPAIVRYIDRMHAALRASGDVLAEQTPLGMSMYTYEFVRDSERDFDAAARVVDGDALHGARVRAARMPVDFVILALRDRYAARGAGRLGSRTRRAARASTRRFRRPACASTGKAAISPHSMHCSTSTAIRSSRRRSRPASPPPTGGRSSVARESVRQRAAGGRRRCARGCGDRDSWRFGRLGGPAEARRCRATGAGISTRRCGCRNAGRRRLPCASARIRR